MEGLRVVTHFRPSGDAESTARQVIQMQEQCLRQTESVSCLVQLVRPAEVARQACEARSDVQAADRLKL